MKHIILSNWKLFISIISFLLLSGCSAGTGKFFVINPPDRYVKMPSISIIDSTSLVNVSRNSKVIFKKELSEALYVKNFQRGSDFRLVYSFIYYDEGSRFLRWLGGNLFRLGKGIVKVQVKYLDSTGKELASIEAEGTIVSGWYGGSLDYAIERAAEQVAEYTIDQFK